MSEEHAVPHLASGALVRVLEDWFPPFPGFLLSIIPVNGNYQQRSQRSSRPCVCSRIEFQQPCDEFRCSVFLLR